MALIGVDLTAYPEAVRKRMAEIWSRENEMAMIQATIRQERIAQFYRDHPPRWRDGTGEQTMAVDPYWAGYFEMLHQDRSRWDLEEKDCQEFLLRNMPMVRVQAVSPKIQVGYRGLSGGTVVKRYGEKTLAAGRSARTAAM